MRKRRLIRIPYYRSQRAHGIRAASQQRGRGRSVLRSYRPGHSRRRYRGVDPSWNYGRDRCLQWVIQILVPVHLLNRENNNFFFNCTADNRSKRKRLARPRPMQDFTVFAEKKENQRIHISPQLTLAMFQYLSTSKSAAGSELSWKKKIRIVVHQLNVNFIFDTAVDPFKPDTISETILRRLLKQDIIYHIKVKSREKARNDPAAVIYQQGKPVDFFVLILEGRVEVTVGKENLMFESGPFTYFGQQALSANVVIGKNSFPKVRRYLNLRINTCGSCLFLLFFRPFDHSRIAD